MAQPDDNADVKEERKKSPWHERFPTARVVRIVDREGERDAIDFSDFFSREAPATPEEVKKDSYERMARAFDWEGYQYQTISQRIEDFFGNYENSFKEYMKELVEKGHSDQAQKLETGLKSLNEQKAAFFTTSGNYTNLSEMLFYGSTQQYGYMAYTRSKYYSDTHNEILGKAKRDLEKIHIQYNTEKGPGSGPTRAA